MHRSTARRHPHRRRRSTRLLLCLLGLVGLVGLVGVVATLPAGGESAPAAVGSPLGDRLARLLDRVAVVEETSYHPGYDRACTPGACVFGEPWTDDHPGPFGHNGCDTRQDVLLQQMRAVELRWGSSCRIFDARLRDPYTGDRLTWRRDGFHLHIDHVYPLARAWHEGAWAWTQRRRLRFANDVGRVLLAVGADANQDKGDRTPSEWLPPRRAYRCRYLVRYVRIAVAYDLPISAADVETARAVLAGC